MTRQGKQRRTEPLTLKELRPIIEDYHCAFPKWHVLEGALLARESGPLLQYIGFERLLGGDYRIQCGVYYLCVPERDGGLIPQWLNVKVRVIRPRSHESLRDKVVEAIHKEIVPSVDAPLDAEQVLAMHEAYQFIRSPDAHHLAVLNTYLGHNDRALYWCSRFTELVNELGNPWQDFDYKRRAFLDQLEQWIKAGEAKRQLERVLQEERRKWGLT
jgi:hypothetical protein